MFRFFFIRRRLREAYKSQRQTFGDMYSMYCKFCMIVLQGSLQWGRGKAVAFSRCKTTLLCWGYRGLPGLANGGVEIFSLPAAHF